MKLSQIKRDTFFKKVIALSVVYTLLFNPLFRSVAIAGEHKISIPDNYGKITSQWHNQSPSDKFVIHIKDIHCNYGIQNNISRILTQLITKHNIKLVTLEGACGPIDTSVFKIFPDVNTKQMVCNKFVKKGVLTGAESLSISRGDDLLFSLWGIEDTDLYIKNLRIFQNALSSSAYAVSSVKHLEEQLNILKKELFPAQLYAFDRQMIGYSRNTVSFDKWTDTLQKEIQTLNISLDEYPNFSMLLQTWQIEKDGLDYDRLTEERQMLPAQIKNRVSSVQFGEFLALDFKFSIGSVSPAQYAKKVKPFIPEENEDFTNLRTFLQLSLLKERIDHKELFIEIDRLARTIKYEFVRLHTQTMTKGQSGFTALCHTLDTISNSLMLYEKLLSLNLNDKELSSYRNSKDSIFILDLISSLSDVASSNNVAIDTKITLPEFINPLQKAVNRAEEFYRLADKRSTSLISNLLTKMDMDHENNAVIITGGFHSRAIEQSLKESNISYVTITPQSSVVTTDIYRKLMSYDTLNLSSLSPMARYIAFPVVCNMILSQSGFFRKIRQDIAQSLFEYKGLPVEVYQAQLKDDHSRKLFNKLLILAGIEPHSVAKTPVSDVLANISPETIVKYILSYDNTMIHNEILRSGAEPERITHEDETIYATYLLSFINLAMRLSKYGFGKETEVTYLIQIIQRTKSPRLSAMHNAAWKMLNDMKYRIEFSDRERDMIAKTGVLEIGKPQLQELGDRILREMDAQGKLNLPPGFHSSNIKIEQIYLDGNIDPLKDILWFKMSVTQPSGIQKRYLVQSYKQGDTEETIALALDALGRRRYDYHLSQQPYQAYSGFRVVELMGSLNAFEFSPNQPFSLDFAQQLGKALAETYIVAGPHYIQNDALRVIQEENKSLRVVNINTPVNPATLSSSPEDISMLIQPLLLFITNSFKKGIDRKTIRAHVDAFIQEFENTIEEIQDNYVRHSDVLSSLPVLRDSPLWHDALERMDPQRTKSSTITDAVSSYLTDLCDHSFSLDEELKLVAFAVLMDLSKETSITIPDSIKMADISIGKRNILPFFLSGQVNRNIWFEAKLNTGETTYSYFFKTFIDDPARKHVNSDAMAIRALSALGRLGYNSYPYYTVRKPWHIYGGFQVSQTIGQYDMSDIDINHPKMSTIANLYGKAIAESLAIGLPDRHMDNLRLVMTGEKPSSVINIDFENVFSKIDFADSFSFAFTYFTRLLDRAQREGMNKQKMRDISYEFLVGFTKTWREIQKNVQAYSQELKELPDFIGNERWIDLIDRIADSTPELERMISDAMNTLNEKYDIHLPSTLTQLQQIVFSIMKDIAKKNNIPISPYLQASDIIVTQHNMSSPIAIDDSALQCIVAVPMANGNRETFAIKSFSTQNRSEFAIRLLQALGRKPYDYYSSGINISHFSGFHVFRVAGNIDADDFELSYDNVIDFAKQLGDAMAQAYMIALPGRSLSNIRVIQKNGKPISLINIGLDRAFSTTADISSALIPLLTLLDRKQFDLQTKRQIVLAFLGQFRESVIELQDNFVEQKALIMRSPGFSNLPAWKTVLKRMDPGQTSEKILIDLVLNELAPFLEEHRITVSRSDVISERTPEPVSKKDRELQELSFKFALELADEGIVSLPDNFQYSDIVIDKKSVALIFPEMYENRISFRFSFIQKDGSRKSFYAKSTRPGDFETQGIFAMRALGLEPYKYYRSSHIYAEADGFHITESVGDMGLDEFDPLSISEADAVAEEIGDALAEAYMLGFVDRKMDNLRVVFKDNNPSAVVNIDLTGALSADISDIPSIVEAFVSYMRKLEKKEYDKPKLQAIAESFLLGFKYSLEELQDYYVANKAHIDGFEPVANYPRWKNVLRRLDPSVNDITILTDQIISYLNKEFGFNIMYESQLPALGLSLLKEMAQNNIIDLPAGITDSDIHITGTNLGTPEVVDDKLPFWFEMSISLADGSEKSYFVKAHSGEKDKTQSVIQAIALLENNQQGIYHSSDQKFGGYNGFHVQESIGEINAVRFDPADPHAFEFVQSLGSAMAEAYVLGLSARTFDKLRVGFEEGIPRSVINGGLSDGLFAGGNISDVLEGFINWINRAKNEGVSQEDISDLIFGFVNGFAVNFKEMQQLYAIGSKDIVNHPNFAGTPEWNEVLKRLDPSQTDVTSVVEDVINELSGQLNFHIESRIEKLLPEDMSDRQRFEEFIQAGQFRRIAPSRLSIDANLFTNRSNTLFIKARDNLLRFIAIQIWKRLGTWRKYPRIMIKHFITFVMITFFSTPGSLLATERLGALAPPMKRFSFKKGIRVSGFKKFKTFIVQKRMKYTLIDLIEQYAKEGNISQINRILDKYFDVQVNMWRRGVYDVDPLFWKNYGVDDPVELTIKTLDIGGLTDNRLLASYLINSRSNYRFLFDTLKEILPPESMGYFTQRYHEVFNIATLNSVWNTTMPSLSESIDVNKYIAYRLLKEKPEGRPGKPAPDERLKQFLDRQEFGPYESSFIHLDMKVFVNSDNTLFLKRWHTPIKRIRDRIKRVIQSPRAVITNMMFILYSYFSTSGVALAFDRLGGLVPPMLRFYSNDDAQVSFEPFKTGKETFVQKKLKHILGDVFEELKAKGDVTEANSLIDKYFDLQIKLWKRGVFDTDMALWKNYGFDNKSLQDLKAFDLSAMTNNRLFAFYVIFFKPSYKRMLHVLESQLPKESVEYFIKRHKEVFSLGTFMHNWDTSAPIPADTIMFEEIPEDSVVDHEPPPIVRSVNSFIQQEGFSSFKAEDSGLESLLLLNKRKDIFLKMPLTVLRGLRYRFLSWRRGYFEVLKNFAIFLLITLLFTEGDSLAAKRLGGLVPPMYKFKFSNAISINVDGEQKSLKEGYFQQSVAFTMGKVFKKYLKEGNIDKAKEMIDKVLELQVTMWRRGVFDRDIGSFLQNYGLNDPDELDIQAFDFGGFTSRISLGIITIIYKLKNKSYFQYEFIDEFEKEGMPKELSDYFVKRLRETYTIRNLLRVWNTEPYVSAQVTDFDEMHHSRSRTISDAPLQIDLRGTEYKRRRAMIRRFLDEIHMEEDVTIRETINSLCEACLRPDSLARMEQILGKQITLASFKTVFASKDTLIYNSVSNLVFSVLRDADNYDSLAILTVAIYEYILSVRMATPRTYSNRQSMSFSIIDKSL